VTRNRRRHQSKLENGLGRTYFGEGLLSEGGGGIFRVDSAALLVTLDEVPKSETGGKRKGVWGELRLGNHVGKPRKEPNPGFFKEREKRDGKGGMHHRIRWS